MQCYLYLMIEKDGRARRHSYIEAPHLLKAIASGQDLALRDDSIRGWELWRGGRLMARMGDRHMRRGKPVKHLRVKHALLKHEPLKHKPVKHEPVKH